MKQFETGFEVVQSFYKRLFLHGFVTPNVTPNVTKCNDAFHIYLGFIFYKGVRNIAGSIPTFDYKM